MGASTIPELRRIPGAAKYVRAALRPIWWLITDSLIAGAENIPPTGPCLIVANHLSRLDAPFGFIAADRPSLTGFAANTYRRQLIPRLFLEAAGVI